MRPRSSGEVSRYELMISRHEFVVAVAGFLEVFEIKRGAFRRCHGFTGQVFQHPSKLGGAERFAQEAVEPGCRTAIPVPLECISRERDHPGAAASLMVSPTDLGNGLEPVHLGHLNVHQHEIEASDLKRSPEPGLRLRQRAPRDPGSRACGRRPSD